MANVYLQDSTLSAIGDAIRAKAGNSTQLYPSEMANAIINLPSTGAELEVIKGLNNHAIVSAYGDAYLTEIGQAGGTVTISNDGVIPLAAMGLQGYENFMKNCLQLQWFGNQPIDDSSVYLYSANNLTCMPAYGSFDNRYVYIHNTYTRTSKNATVGGWEPSFQGFGNVISSYCLDTITGNVYKVISTLGSYQSFVSVSLGESAGSIGAKTNKKVYYKKKI